MVKDSWFRNLWKTSKNHEAGPEKMRIGVLAFEVARSMSKLVHLWHSLSDKQVFKSREEISNSVGIKKLISEDDDYIAGLICAEMIESLKQVSRSVARLAEKCSDPLFRSFERAFDDRMNTGVDTYKWQFSWKKMDRKVKKMEGFVLVNANLYQEVETLTELEQILKRMKGNDNPDNTSLLEYEKRVVWKQHEVKHLKEISLWNRTYDYIVRLLAKSLFTIINRIEHVFGISHGIDAGIKHSGGPDSDYIHRSHSVSGLMQSSVHPSENRVTRFSSGPLGNVSTNSGPISRANKTTHFYSGPLTNSITTPNPISGKHKATSSYSGPLGISTTKSGPLPRALKTGLRFWQSRESSKANRLATAGAFKGCMMGGNTSPVKNCHINSSSAYPETSGETIDNVLPSDVSIFNSKHRLLNAPPETLGAAALALHYANVIIVIEKLVASPHLIGQDAREDLYNMLPANVRAALRTKLKPFTKSLASSVYDTVLAGEWSEAMSGILDWLAPLAHNMIRWQSERSFEHQNLLSRTSVLLVQTLYFANQEKTEATIAELLVGLNYIWRFGRELTTKALVECDSGRTFDDSLSSEG